MDPIRNPYAPGAGQRPPELAGRDTEIASFEIALERIARGRPERSTVLTGLRGVGKTVLLNALRSSAVRASWGTGKFEARPDQPVRQPIAAAIHMAVRELSGADGLVSGRTDARHILGVIKAFAQREASGARTGAKKTTPRDRWQPGIDVPAATGRADSGDIEIDLVELFIEVAGLAADNGRGIGIFIDEMQDLDAADVSALCAACHELSQQGLPLIVVGAGLPHLPAVLSASKSYSERLFHYARIDRLGRAAAADALRIPARDESADFTDEALEALYVSTGGYPYFIQAHGKAAWDAAPRSPITAADVAAAEPEANSELAVGFFGSRYERATPAERDYLRAMAQLDEPDQTDSPTADKGNPLDSSATSVVSATDPVGDMVVTTAQVASVLSRSAQSVSPARDALIKKGLIYSAERGQIAFTVPHFGRYLRTQHC